MPPSARIGSTLLAAALCAAGARAQAPGGDRPEPASPSRPETREQLDHREALKLYGRAMLAERQNRLLEAVRLYEQATRLDPEASAPLKSLVPLYLALDRLDDALVLCKKATDLDPADHATWHLYARQLRAQNRLPDAAVALGRALDCASLKEHPDLRAQIAFDLGALQESQQDFAKAEAAFVEVVRVLDNPAALLEQGEFSRDEIDGQAADTYERLGRVCVRAGKPERAVDYFVKARDKVKDKDPNRAKRLAYNLAEVHLARAEWADALRSLDEFLETLPQGTDAYRAKIKALEKLGRREDVLLALEAHAARDRHNAALKLLLAEQYGASGDTDHAVRLYDELAKSSPGPDVYRGLFALHAGARPARQDLVLNLLDEALKQGAAPEDGGNADADAAARGRSMLAVLRESPDLVRGLLPVAGERLKTGGSLAPQTGYFLGVLAARTRQLDAAEQMFRAALTQRGGGRGNRGFSGDLYDNLLRVLNLAHKHEAVIALCREGLEQAPNIYPEFFHRQAAEAYAHLGRAAEAVAAADKAVDVSPDDRRLSSRLTRAHVLAQVGRFESAVAECLDLLKSTTKTAEVRRVRHQLSTVHSMAHQYAPAEEQLRLLLQDDADDAWACNDLGYFWAEQGKNLDEAEKLIRKALELDRKNRGTVVDDADKENAAYIDSLGWVLFRRGQFDAARKELERAAALPDGAEDPAVWDHLGDVRARQGDAAGAAAAWRKAVELWEVVRSRPKDDHYNETRQKLRQ